MSKPKALVLRAAGTNCDRETQYALELAGFEADRVHVFRLMENPALLAEYQMLAIPGGFSYGDDVAAGKILANQMLQKLQEPLNDFIAAGKAALGICNGFQVLIKSGLLPWGKVCRESANRDATLGWNDSGKFETRWVYLRAETDKCVFLKKGDMLPMPVAHGEGKFIPRDDGVFDRLVGDGQVALRYVDADGNSGSYPVNPNGSTSDIAGICDPTGRVMGLMPHPERFVVKTQHPRWTRENIDTPAGLTVFQRAFEYVSSL